MIDYRSDTITRPSPEMLQAMMAAKVGDDVFGEDPTVNELEAKIAQMLGKEAALFCPSGTMSNQLAVNAHTHPGDEIILSSIAHIYYYEGGGIARNSGVSACLLQGDRGRFTAEDVLEHINPTDDVHRPITRMVAVENTMNKGGGAIWDLDEIKKISAVCRENGLKFHMDGARLFNAVAETGIPVLDYAQEFDSVSICLSKGLGCPVGSLLVGNKELIKRAHRVRKVWGGGMRQIGYLAAAGIYALDHHIERLADDNQKAKRLGEVLQHLPFVESVLGVESNIVIFNLKPEVAVADVLAKLEENHVYGFGIGKGQVRLVTHLDITDQMLEETIQILESIQL